MKRSDCSERKSKTGDRCIVPGKSWRENMELQSFSKVAFWQKSRRAQASLAPNAFGTVAVFAAARVIRTSQDYGFSPSVSFSALQAQPRSPHVFCCDRCPGQEQFPPKQPDRQTSFHVPARSAKPIHTPDYEAKCFATTPEDRL